MDMNYANKYNRNVLDFLSSVVDWATEYHYYFSLYRFIHKYITEVFPWPAWPWSIDSWGNIYEHHHHYQLLYILEWMIIV